MIFLLSLVSGGHICFHNGKVNNDIIIQPMTNSFIFKHTGTRKYKSLSKYDKLMREGTQYWMRQFMLAQASHYEEQLSRTVMYNKEEKMIHDANEVFRIEEEMMGEIYKNNLGDGVFFEQSIGSGKSDCIKHMTERGDNIIWDDECDLFLDDLSSQIYR